MGSTSEFRRYGQRDSKGHEQSMGSGRVQGAGWASVSAGGLPPPAARSHSPLEARWRHPGAVGEERPTERGTEQGTECGGCRAGRSRSAGCRTTTALNSRQPTLVSAGAFSSLPFHGCLFHRCLFIALPLSSLPFIISCGPFIAAFSSLPFSSLPFHRCPFHRCLFISCGCRRFAVTAVVRHRCLRSPQQHHRRCPLSLTVLCTLPAVARSQQASGGSRCGPRPARSLTARSRRSEGKPTRAASSPA